MCGFRLFCSMVLFSCALSATTIDFESLADSSFVTTQFTGLVFSNTQVLSAGISLNELEFPPHSGTNVVTDAGGPISVVFDSPVSSVSGFFTYLSQLTFVAYDSSAHSLGQTTSAFSNNLAMSGDPGSSPNEYLQLNFADISEIVITGSPAGGSFVMDDFSYSSGTGTTIPEPSTFGVILCLCLAVAAWGGRHRVELLKR